MLSGTIQILVVRKMLKILSARKRKSKLKIKQTLRTVVIFSERIE